MSGFESSWGNHNVTASALPVLFFYAPHRILTRSSPLAVPKNPCGIRLAIFDRGAAKASLNRPQGALRHLRPWGNHNVTASALPVLFFYAKMQGRILSACFITLTAGNGLDRSESAPSDEGAGTPQA
ncbi:MAG: hypothetical protein IJA06_02200 [Oscillospiraceae bacterium]|nr:hypothetical protein [Oscillospiraceae bacterium]